MESLNIRPIKRSDCAPITKLIRELGESKLTPKDLDRLGFSDDKYGPPFFLGVVAEIKVTSEPQADDDKSSSSSSRVVIGVGLYHVKYSTWEGPVMHLNTFVVGEKYRRQRVGTKLLGALAKIAVEKKYPRISLEVSKSSESGCSFFAKHGAVNMTKDEGWLNYDLDLTSVKKMLEGAKEPDNNNTVRLRPTEPKDCVQIKDMIQELAGFEKMSDGPKLSVKDLQRDGFYKLHPDFYSFVAEFEDEESQDVEIIGYMLLFLTFDPLLGKRVHLEDLYVTPKHRGKRVGELLFQEVGRFVQKEGYQGFTLEVLDWNTKAIQFYDKFGGINKTEGEQGIQSVRFKQDAISKLAELSSLDE